MFDKQTVLEFIKKQSLAVLSTVTPSHKSESAVMAIAVTDTWEVLMSTEPTTRKVANIKTNPHTSLIIGGLESPSVQLDGQASLFSGPQAEAIKHLILTIHPDTAPYLSPTTVYIKFVPTWLRYSDYSQNPPQIFETEL